jgi:hypothetical protein
LRRRCAPTTECRDGFYDRDFSTEERKEAAAKGEAMKGGGYPIKKPRDVKNAIRAIGRAKNPSATKRFIKKRASALGVSNLIPEDWGDRMPDQIDTSLLMLRAPLRRRDAIFESAATVTLPDAGPSRRGPPIVFDSTPIFAVSPREGGDAADSGGTNDGGTHLDDGTTHDVSRGLRMYDAVELDDAAKVRISPTTGFLTAMPRIARTGIQLYRASECGKRDSDEIVRVYRPQDSVFATDAWQSYTHLPVTLDHPPVAVDAKNWKKYAVGETADEVLRDGQAARVPMMLRDHDAVQAWKDGKNQLSVGYDCDLDWTPGTTADGEPYDAIQRNIRANHLAVVAAARGGPSLSIGDRTRDNNEGVSAMNTTVLKTVTIDGLDVQMPETAVAVVQKTLLGLQDANNALKKWKKEKEDEDEDRDEEDQKKDAALKAKDAPSRLAMRRSRPRTPKSSP